MTPSSPHQDRDAETNASSWKGLCRIGGGAAFLQLLCAIMTMIVAFGVGGEPSTVNEYFDVLQNNRLVGLLRMDFASVINVTLFFLTFFSLYAALRRAYGGYAALATILAFVGVTLWLSAHSGFSMIVLSDQYAAATSDVERSQLVAAGQAVLASDMWHNTGTFVGGILLEGAGVIFSLLMLRTDTFGKVAAIVGLAVFGLDLIHILLGILLPEVAIYLMVVAGSLYPVWFVLVGWRLLQLGRKARPLVAA